MSTTTVNTANTAYYAVYRSSVTNYYYSSSWTSRTLYRNGVYGTATNYTMYLATTNTGLTNATIGNGPGSSAFDGLLTATPRDTSEDEFDSVAAAAKSTYTKLYAIYRMNITYAKGSNVSSIGKTSDHCWVEQSETSCTVALPTITAASGYASVGWSTTSGATSGTSAGINYTLSTNNTKLYANALQKPTFAENVEGETVITYPSGCGSTYTCTYKIGSGSAVTVTSTTATAYTTSSQAIVATVASISSSYTSKARNKFYVSSSGNDTTGYGTINKPYATLAKAYAIAPDTATIYLMSNITQTSTFAMNSTKAITLTSCTKSGSGTSVTCSYSANYSATRGSSLTEDMIQQTKGSLVLSNITIDGNNVTSQKPMITVSTNTTINSGTILQNGKNTSTTAHGGAIRVLGGSLTLNGGEIKNNSAPYGGGIHTDPNTTLTINQIDVAYNTASAGGGGVYINGDAYLKGGTIRENSTSTTDIAYAGGFDIHHGTLYVTGGSIYNNTNTNYPQHSDMSLPDYHEGKVYDSGSGLTIDGTIYHIVSSLKTSAGLNVDGGNTANYTNIQLWEIDNNNRWRIIPARVYLGVVYYRVETQISGAHYMVIDGNSSAAGANVQIWQADNAIGHLWKMTSAGSGSYYFESYLGTCLDLSGGNTANGTNIDAYTCNQSGAQKWKLVATS